jgi:hypothetical protein
MGNRNKDKVVIANCSGFFGDRLSAAREMVQGGPIDFLTGDYLAELTMAILFRTKMKHPNGGYVQTYLTQMEEVMGECLDKKIKIVSNAGGLNPKGLAAELEALSARLGLHPRIAYIDGDDLLPRLAEFQGMGEEFVHMDKNIPLKDAKGMVLTANAYFGCWGIVKALEEGADIIVGGRIADASVVAGPAAWWYGWKENEWDKLAGAYTAGHIIECGAQATGGNYSFIDDVPDFRKVGFPLAEVHPDGSFIITKHPHTGGLVSVDTVKAQLMYEISTPSYLTPDVIARFDTIDISQSGTNRVLVKSVKGEPPTDTTKVCINTLGGYRNSSVVVLTGLDIEKKAKIVEDALFDAVGGRDQFQVCDVQLVRSNSENPASNEEAFAYLRLSVIDSDQKKVDKFSARVVELALANIPGFTLTAMPAKGIPALIYWPALMSTKHINQHVVIGGNEFNIEFVKPVPGYPSPAPLKMKIPKIPEGKTVNSPLGRVFASRSGDKGGNANLGVWARTPEGYAWLEKYLTPEKLKEIMKDLKSFEIERYELPNLLAVNFYIRGILGDGVASSLRMDPQAKTLGEYFRAKVVEMPKNIVQR